MADRKNVLVSYDVDTTTREGRSRLRKLAKTCVNYGQRVQYSVFECSVTETDYVKMVAKMCNIIDENQDSLRIYHLPGERNHLVNVYGRDQFVDYEKPLIL